MCMNRDQQSVGDQRQSNGDGRLVLSRFEDQPEFIWPEGEHGGGEGTILSQ